MTFWYRMWGQWRVISCHQFWQSASLFERDTHGKQPTAGKGLPCNAAPTGLLKEASQAGRMQWKERAFMGRKVSIRSDCKGASDQPPSAPTLQVEEWNWLFLTCCWKWKCLETFQCVRKSNAITSFCVFFFFPFCDTSPLSFKSLA